MPLDERDAKFEKALGRHLRAECPDAEILAAYHERTLAPDELLLWKKHIVGCSACQEVLANLETTESIPVGELVNQEVLAAKASPRPGMLPVQAAAKAEGWRAVAVPMRSRVWRWTAPAGAIAAGLLVWLVVRDQDRNMIVPRSPAPAAAPAAQKAESAQESKNAEVAMETAHAADQGRGLGTKEEERKLPKDVQASGRTMQGAPLRSLDKTQQGGNERDDRFRASQDAVDEKRKAPMSAPKAEVSSEAAPALAAPTPAAQTGSTIAQNNAVPPPPPPPSGTVPEEAAKKNAEFGALRQQAGGKLTSNYKQDAYLSDAAAALGGQVIRSADGKAAWRIGENGAISRLDLKAGTAKEESTGATAELVSGSAPTENVCWVVGRRGTILRTTDGGGHWESMTSPTKLDLAGIRATDEKHAVVWVQGSDTGYETTDGGSTWKVVSNP